MYLSKIETIAMLIADKPETHVKQLQRIYGWSASELRSARALLAEDFIAKLERKLEKTPVSGA